MTATTIETARRDTTRRAPSSDGLSKEAWARIFVTPYVLIFLTLVVFPVGYAFWLARDPQLYVELAKDPV
ncbi:MAG: sugar ABC transporter permease, partial [Alphaproteobacteria bacterium]|nr:sugar ABC transporter permease [Alphaproteobacteria bacterium]